jgi:hypothetical protein
MPAAPDNITFINIRDFRPGISDVPGAEYPAGSAQRAGTWRCIANRAGALTPMPRNDIPFSMPVDEAAPVEGKLAINGLYVPSMGVLSTTGYPPINLLPSHELFVGNEWLNGTSRRVRVRRFRRFDPTPTGHDLIKDVSTADTGTALTVEGMDFGSIRSNRANPTLPNVDPNLPNIINPGNPGVIMMWTNGFLASFLSQYPDDQAPSSNVPYDIWINNFILGIVCHQGRVVAQYATNNPQGPNAFMFTGENLRWSAVNDVNPANWSQVQVFVPENPSGYAFLCSMTANELFAVKSNGAMVVSGSLNTPTVTTLPMVIGSEVNQRAVSTQIGAIYGNESVGVIVWPHGDTSQILSPQLQSDFWLLDPFGLSSWGGCRYGFARCDDWILVPNNWVYDIALKSWWRIENPGVAAIRYWTCISEHIYGSDSYYTNAAPTPIHYFKRDVPATSYSWQSHPLWETVNNLVDLREIVLRVEGYGSITVTMTGETSSSSITFSGINAALPVMLRQPCRLQDSNIAIKVEATGSPGLLGSVVAPTILELNCGYVTSQRERTSV